MKPAALVIKPAHCWACPCPSHAAELLQRKDERGRRLPPRVCICSCHFVAAAGGAR